MRRRGIPVYQAQTGLIAILVLATLGLLFATVKVSSLSLYVPITSEPNSHSPNYAFTYVLVMYVALAVMAVSSAGLGIDIAGLRGRIANRLAMVVTLLWSWSLFAAMAAPAALKCGRGILPDPYLSLQPGSTNGPPVYVGVPKMSWADVVDHAQLAHLPWPAQGVYVNLCSTATQQAAHWATGLAALGLALTVLPAVATFVIVRIARTTSRTAAYV